MPDTTHVTGDPEDDVDALARLRAADPVAPDEVAAASTSARARALRAEIVMQTESSRDTHDNRDARTAVPGRVEPRWWRPLVATLAVVLLAAAGTVGAQQLAGDRPPPGDVVADAGRVDPEAADDELPADTPPVDQVEVDPITPGGGMALCAVTYTPETLLEREVAFLGTVTTIEGDEATFEVEEAFRGDLGDAVTLGGAEYLSVPNPDNVNPITVGGRYLVAGDGGFAWGCGFTQLHSDEMAAEWRTAFAR